MASQKKYAVTFAEEENSSDEEFTEVGNDKTVDKNRGDKESQGMMGAQRRRQVSFMSEPQFFSLVCDEEFELSRLLETGEPLTSEHLHKAVNNNDVEAVIQILEAGETTEQLAPNGDGEPKVYRFRRDVGVDVPDKYGLTALMSASQRGFTGIIDVLIKCGASVNEKNSSGKNCLMLACFAGHLDIVKQLRAYGCDWESRDLGGCTAMHWACDGGHVKVVEWMIQDGAQVDVSDYKSGWTPLFRVAALNGDPQIAQRLIEAGAEVNRKDKDGKTPLMIAALNGHKKLVQLLVEAGADFKVKNEFGNRAVEMAQTFDRRPVVKYLEQLQESEEEKRKFLRVQQVKMRPTSH